MHTLKKSTILFAISLSALAGYVDAIGFLQAGGYFVSFMSGNSTQLAVQLVEGNIQHALLPLAIILCFVTGALLGALVSHFAQGTARASRVLLLVTILLMSAALCYGMHLPLAAIFLMALAMGSENAIFQRAGDVAVGLTYMTGTLVKMGHRLANSLLGGEKYAWVPYLLLWLGLVTGGVCGAFLFNRMGLYSLWLGVVWSALLTGISARITIN